MKKFSLLEIQILSTTEKKAKKVIFDPTRTIILGKNETGKSSLLKTIYNTFGAAPAKQSNKWRTLNPISFVRFQVDEEGYSILKDGKFYAVYNSEDKIVNVFDSVTNGLGPFLAKLLNFKIRLANQEGSFITPPPAFQFLPFYVDQDAGWQEPWKSFNNLSQVKKYKRPIIEYHTGLRPNEYYETRGEIEKLEKTIQSLDQERKLSKSILDKVKERLSDIDFTIDLDEFKEEIQKLLVECELLRTGRDKIKNKLVDFINLKITVETQLTITKQALNEAKKDYNYTILEVEDHIDCPTCGAHYENSFMERFEIAMDENRCKDLLVNLNRELQEIDEKINKENENLNRRTEELLKVESLLEMKKGAVKLRDLIESEGRKELKNVFQTSINELQETIKETALKQQDLNTTLKAYEDKKRKDNIRSDYRALMHKYLRELGVFLQENDYKDLTRNIANTGSALPRTLTAYYFSIFEVMKKYSSSAFCPIIIDSPNQQGQDSENIDRILLFIKNNQPSDSQLILGLENSFNIDFGYNVVNLEDKHSLLQDDEYEEVYTNLTPFLNSIWSSGKTGRLF